MIWLEDHPNVSPMEDVQTILRPDRELFNRARRAFLTNEHLRQIPVVQGETILGVCRMHDSEIGIEQKLDAILSDGNWDLRYAFSRPDGVLCLHDLSEITWRIREYAHERRIPVHLTGLHWECVGAEDSVHGLKSYMRIQIDGENQAWIHQAYAMLCMTRSIAQNSGISVSAAAAELDARLHDHKPDQWDYGTTNIAYESLPGILCEEEKGSFAVEYAQRLGKQLAAVYGNCHFSVVVRYLLQAEAFVDRYLLIVVPPVFDMEQLGITHLSEHLLQKLNLLIYQQINPDNLYGKQWATADILPRLSPDCRRVCVPNTVFMGYFPQEGRRSDTILKNQINHVPLFCGDKYIDRVFRQCGSISKTVELLRSPDFLTREEVLRNLKRSLRMLELQDMGCDIPMKDYVESNFRDQYLFTEPKHPANRFFREMTERILRFIGLDTAITDADRLDQEDTLSTINRLLYPAVEKHLELRFQVTEYYCDRRLTGQRLTFQEFVEVYVRNTCTIDPTVQPQ